MPQNENGKTLREIIIGAAIVGVALAVSNALPFICFFILPLSVLYCRARFSKKNSITISLIAMIFVGIGSQGVLADIFFFLGLILLGYTMGECYDRKLSIEKTVIWATGTILSTCLVGFIFYSNQSGTGFFSLVNEHVGRNLELTLQLYETMGMSKESIQMFSANFDRIQHDMVRLIPAITIALTLFIVWLNLLFSRSLLKISRLNFYDFGILNQWKAPEPLVWFAIGSGLMLLIPVDSLRLISLNGLIILMTIYFFQGIAIVSFYFEKKRFPRLLKVFMYSIIAVQQILLFLIIGLGFFDMWMNFRKLDQKETS